MKFSEVEALVRDLRAMADFIETNGVELPRDAVGIDRVKVKIYTTDKDAIVKAAKTLSRGASIANPLVKDMSSYSYELRRKFGEYGLIEVWSGRDTVCVKKQVGTRKREVEKFLLTGEFKEEPVYEYECHPLLTP